MATFFLFVVGDLQLGKVLFIENFCIQSYPNTNVNSLIKFFHIFC